MSTDEPHACGAPDFAGFCWQCAEPPPDGHDDGLWPFPTEPLIPPSAGTTAPDAP